MSDLDTIFDDDWPENHRSGVVAVVGRPNVGKSTLINAILGQKIAIVTPKPQTTRRQQLGIYTEEKGQMLFVDTPGLHKPLHKLGEYMVEVAEAALKDADVILWILDVSEPPTDADRIIAQTIKKYRKDTPVVLALNKMDKLSGGLHDITEHLELIEHHSMKRISALNQEGVTELVQHLLELLPEGPRYYPVDQLSDVNMRFIAAEIIREKAIMKTEQEIPHVIAVEVESYKEQEDRITISATIYVERDSQKGIIIGKGGRMIKAIGTEARQELMETLQKPVHLDLHVKALKNWRSNEKLMKRLGYHISARDKD